MKPGISVETLTTLLSSEKEEATQGEEEDEYEEMIFLEKERAIAEDCFSIDSFNSNFSDKIDEDILETFRTKSHKNIKSFFALFPKLIHFSELPHWLQDNEFIKHGYRAPAESLKQVCLSLIQFHNESINVWTHIVGSLSFIAMAVWFMTRPFVDVPGTSKLIFLPFFVGATLCMGCSAAFHLVFFKSKAVGAFFAKLDYSGIALLIIGSFIPWIYYAFNCWPSLIKFYMISIIVMGVAAIIVSLFEKFAQPKYRPLRAGIFLVMGLSAVVPVIHLFFIEDLKIIMAKELIIWNILMGSLYVIGAVQYSFRFPERCFQGKFDYLFHSHQFFHIFVVAAAFIHFHGICRVAMIQMESGSCQEQVIESGKTLWVTWFG
uniref:HlyIII-domain-containing protein n=1 Tax=Rhabditophanes sp. KR3021 TaxID=114890 RepID=A0AC35TP60_9BILA